MSSFFHTFMKKYFTEVLTGKLGFGEYIINSSQYMNDVIGYISYGCILYFNNKYIKLKFC